AGFPNRSFKVLFAAGLDVDLRDFSDHRSFPVAGMPSLAQRAQKKKAPAAPPPIPSRQQSMPEQNSSRHHRRASGEQGDGPGGRPSAVAAVRTALADQRALIFVGGREHAGEAAPGGSGIGFEVEQRGSGAAIPAYHHGIDDGP